MILFNNFRRRFMTWRTSQFKDLVPISSLPELPMGSVLFILDNFQMDGVSIPPRQNNPIIGLNNHKLYMKNVLFPTESQSDVAPLVTNKIILTSAGVVSQLQKYRQNMAPRVLWCDDIRDMPKQRPAVQGVVNFNPLFRARVLGMRRKPRFMNLLWAMVINQIVQAPDKMCFIHVPLESLVFGRNDFNRVFKKYDRVSTKYPEISSYLFLAHLYSILMKPMSLPKRGAAFEETPEDEKEINLESWQVDPASFDDGNYNEFMTNIENYMLKDPSLSLEALNIKDSENPYKQSIFEYLPVKYFENVNFILTNGSNCIIYNLRDLKELNQNGIGIMRIINHVNLLTSSGQVTQSPEDINNEEVETVGEEVTEVPEPETKANQPEYKKPMTKEDKLEAAEFDLSELDNIEKIVQQSSKTLEKPLTIAQKERVKHLSRTYKTIKIGDKTIQELIQDVPEVQFDKMPDFTLDVIDQGMVDKSILKSSTRDLDEIYIQSGAFDRDIASVLTSFNKLGMFLVDVNITDKVDELNELREYTVKYEDIEHKKHVIKFQIPRVDNLGRAKINGSLKCMIKQRVANPICKVRPTRVTLNSNYNKLLVERNTNVAHSFIHWFMKALEKVKQAGWQYTLSHVTCTYPRVALPFELTEIGKKYDKITFKGGMLYFAIMQRGSFVPEKYRTQVQTMEKENGCWFGYKGDNMFFLTNTGVVTVIDMKTNEEVFYGAFIDFFQWLTDCEMSSMVEYADLTILSWKVPVIHPLCYRYGLTDMLRYTGVNYDAYESGERYDKRASDIVIKFSDKKLVIHRTPRNMALLFGGLTSYDLSNVTMEEMDEKDVYYELLTQKKVSTNLIKGINALFDLFIDPITRDVLREMNEPTDLRDLLIRAVSMLTTSEHREEASAANFRFRGVEQITGIVYNEMARAFATYKNKGRGSTNKFSMKEYQVKQRIAKEQLTENVSIINPIDDIKTYSKFSNAGSGGRSNDTFMITDRQFTQDQVGVVSEATVDNGKTGMNATLPANPVIVNERGMVQETDVANLQPENVLSFNSLLMPCATNDDKQ